MMGKIIYGDVTFFFDKSFTIEVGSIEHIAEIIIEAFKQGSISEIKTDYDSWFRSQTAFPVKNLEQIQNPNQTVEKE